MSPAASRREFLLSSGAAVAAAALASPAAAARLPSAPPLEQRFRVGYQIYSWQRYYPAAWWEAARQCAAVGFHGIEGEYTMAGLYAGREPEFAQRMRRIGEVLAAVYSTTDLGQRPLAYVNRYKNQLSARFAQPQGTKVLVIGGTDAHERTDAIFTEYARQANEIGKEVYETTGLRVGVHPHIGSLVQHRADIDRVMETTDPRYFNLCPDVGHLAAGGMVPAEIIRIYAQRVIHVHFKDYAPPAAGARFGRFVELGQGMANIPAVVRELETIGFDGWADVELDGAGDPEAAARRNRDYLEKVLHLRIF